MYRMLQPVLSVGDRRGNSGTLHPAKLITDDVAVLVDANDDNDTKKDCLEPVQRKIFIVNRENCPSDSPSLDVKDRV